MLTHGQRVEKFKLFYQDVGGIYSHIFQQLLIFIISEVIVDLRFFNQFACWGSAVKLSLVCKYLRQDQALRQCNSLAQSCVHCDPAPEVAQIDVLNWWINKRLEKENHLLRSKCATGDFLHKKRARQPASPS